MKFPNVKRYLSGILAAMLVLSSCGPTTTVYADEEDWPSLEEVIDQLDEDEIRAILADENARKELLQFITEEDIQNILDNCKIKPAVNQIRVHIGHTPSDVIDYCKDQDILIMAFSPNATGKLMGHPLVTSLAEKYGVSVPQLSIRYDLQLGLMPLPRSTNPEHIRENAELDFVVSDEDMKRLGEVEEIQSLG